MAHFAARVADHGKAFRQALFQREIIQRGNQLALGEIAGGAEDHQHAGVRFFAMAESIGRVQLRIARHRRYPFLTAWPPNSLRSAATTLAEKESSWRDAKRANSESMSTGAGTLLSIASSTVQRPSPESST